MLSKMAYLFTGLLFFLIPFSGLVLESLNIHWIGFESLFFLYLFSIGLSLMAREWKLALVVCSGTIAIYALTLGVSEVLWYYLKTWFAVDISYR